MTKSNGLYYYDDDEILYCKNDFGYYTNGVCGTSCGSGYITYPGVDKNKGYCSFKCTLPQKCENDYQKEDVYLNYENDKFCKNPSSSYNLFFECVDPTINYYIQYSGFYNSQTIKIGLKQSLESYIIEFWFYPDFFLQAKAQCNGLLFRPN